MPTTCPHRVTVLTTMVTCSTLASQAWTRPRRLHCWSTRHQGTAYQVVSLDQGLLARHLTCLHISAVLPLHQHQTWMPLDAPVRSQVVLVDVHAQQPVAVEETHSYRLSWMRCVTLLNVSEPRTKATVWLSSGSLQGLSLTASALWPSVSLTSSAPSPSSCQHPTLLKLFPRTSFDESQMNVQCRKICRCRKVCL